ncbi:hypothetical protein BHMPCIPO_04656 [Ensifer sesbaniae]|nr:hypothetical protein [Ensifer sesbaniae]
MKKNILFPSAGCSLPLLLERPHMLGSGRFLDLSLAVVPRWSL